MSVIDRQLETALKAVVEDLSLSWFGFEWANDHGRRVLRIYVEAEGGVTIDQCAKASRELSALLDVELMSDERYQLEVSSPGVNYPLFNAAQYQRALGQRVQLRLRVPDVTGRRRFTGIVRFVDGERVLIDVDENEQSLEVIIPDIEKANVVADICF